MNNYAADNIKAVKTAQTAPTDVINIYQGDADQFSSYKNEMLFFIKPEITLPSQTINLEKVLDIVFERCEKFGMTPANISVLGAKYLKEKNIMASHYGVINKLSNNAKGEMSQTAKENFVKNYGLSLEDANILGGHEFMNKYPYFNADSLEILWQNVTSSKLAGGTYCAPIKLNGETIYMIDGFHPKQLAHFIEDGKSIVVFRMFTNTDWGTARNAFIGATNPHKANEGSIRQIFLAKKDELGLEDVSQGSNGVHLSAGPVEGLVELCRFSDKSFTDEGNLQNHVMGRELLQHYKMDKIKQIVNDAKVTFDGKETSVFEMTEDKNTVDACDMIRKAA